MPELPSSNDGTSNRLLAFASEATVGILCRADTIYMDGTFSIVPKIFHQLCTIHAFYRGRMIPCAHFLLHDESTDTYSRMFRLLKDYAATKGFDMHPRYFRVDYEAGILKAIERSFPNSETKGYLFHFCQAVHAWSLSHQKPRYENHQ